MKKNFDILDNRRMVETVWSSDHVVVFKKIQQVDVFVITEL